MSHTFENWSRSVKFTPKTFVRPTSEAEVVQVVTAAAEAGQCVRTQGAGHSFSQILTTNDVLLKLDRLPDKCVVSGTQATVCAGMQLKEVIAALQARGLGLRNIGSVTEQSIAGAFSTGTHGTGICLGSLASQVSAVRLVDGQGQVRQLTSAADLAVARVNVGMLGVITEVTLDCVPYYNVEYNAYLCRFGDVIDRIDDLKDTNERALLWWLRPPTGPQDRVVIIIKNSPGAPPGFPANDPVLDDHAIPGLSSGLSFDAGLLGVVLLGLPVGAGRFRRILRYTAGYEDVLTIPLLPVFHRECEYAIPAAHAADALRELRTVLDEGDVRLILPIEVRFQAEETHLLSTAHNRPQGVCYIGVASGVEVMANAPEVFERFEPIMRAFGGRPHWGKHFNLNRKELAAMYPASHSSFTTNRGWGIS